MREQLLKFCLEKGILLDKDTLGLIENLPDNLLKEIVEKISQHFDERIITKSFFSKNFEKLRSLFLNEATFVEKLSLNLGISLEVKKEIEIVQKEKKNLLSYDSIKFLSSLDLPSKRIEIEDFVRYFRARFSEMKKILQERQELNNLVSINRVNGQKQNLSIIAGVFSKRFTKNKNLILEVEDLTGRAQLLVNLNKPEIFEKARELLLDDIVAFKCSGTREMLFVNDIIFPDALLASKKKIEKDVSIAFTSDIHVGSNVFLEKELLKFISWLNGEVGDEEQKKEALKVKYLFVVGDTIDGIGVYPGQEMLLTIKDATLQYNRLAEILKMIRKDVKIILSPGQHDAVRVAEPQPAIGKEYGSALYELENVLLVNNPSYIEIEGFKILIYHGASMSSIINDIDELRVGKAHHTPAKVVRHMLKRRHLASSHSSVTYIPMENRDPLMILDVPDVIVTADLHRPDVDIYNNILIVCSSCWQDTTPFEEKIGNEPDPCKVPILNLKTRAIKILDFSEEKR